MRAIAGDKIYTVEEYIQEELSSEVRHEFINGQLYEMAGEKDINNELAFAIALLFAGFLKVKGYTVYNHDVKVAIPGQNKYYYPDVFVTKEVKNEYNRYIKYETEIIIEIVSESTHSNDYIDKYIDYTKIPSLKYYLIVEPETTLITVFERDGDNWVTHKYTQLGAIVKLPLFNVEFLVKQVYE